MRWSVVVAVAFAIVAMSAACGWDWTVVPKAGDGGDAGAADATDAKSGGPCLSNDNCPSDEFCLYDDFSCGAKRAGLCAALPPATKCTGGNPPDDVAACGCDGKTGANSCAVQLARNDLSASAPCVAPADTFRCGFLFCPRTTYCLQSLGFDSTSYECIPWKCSEKACTCNEFDGLCKVKPVCTPQNDGWSVVTCGE